MHMEAEFGTLRAYLCSIKSAVAPLSQYDDDNKEKREAAMHELIGLALDVADRLERAVALIQRTKTVPEHGAAARRGGHAITDCPFDASTKEGKTWRREWNSAV